MKFCSHCGKEILDEAVICPNCGCSVQYDNAGGGNANRQTAPQYTDSYSALSVAGLILAFFEPLVGLILSIMAHSDAKKTGSGKSLSLAKAGIIVSAVFLGIVAACLMIWIVFFILNIVIWF